MFESSRTDGLPLDEIEIEWIASVRSASTSRQMYSPCKRLDLEGVVPSVALLSRHPMYRVRSSVLHVMKERVRREGKEFRTKYCRMTAYMSESVSTAASRSPHLPWQMEHHWSRREDVRSWKPLQGFLIRHRIIRCVRTNGNNRSREIAKQAYDRNDGPHVSSHEKKSRSVELLRRRGLNCKSR